MGKRPAASSAAAAAKAAKMVDPIDLKCQQVAAALQKIESLPPAVHGMLGDILPFSLGLFKEERHNFQQRVVDVVGAEMSKLEEALANAVTEAETKVEQFGKDKEAQEASVVALGAQLDGHKKEVHEKKNVLADTALAFRSAKEALAEAEAKQRAVDDEVKEATSKHEELAAIITEVLEPLKEGTLGKEKALEAATGLVPRLQGFFTVEESLVPAIPAVLSKEPSARGPFDTMAAVQLEEQTKKALDELSTAIKGGEASRAKRAAIVAAATEGLQAARERQRADAEALIAAKSQEEASQGALDAAKKALKALNPERLRRGKAVTKAQEAVSSFRDGPLATFKELSERTKEGPPPAVAQEEQGAVAEPGLAAEEAVETAEAATSPVA